MNLAWNASNPSIHPSIYRGEIGLILRSEWSNSNPLFGSSFAQSIIAVIVSCIHTILVYTHICIYSFIPFFVTAISMSNLAPFVASILRDGTVQQLVDENNRLRERLRNRSVVLNTTTGANRTPVDDEQDQLGTDGDHRETLDSSRYSGDGDGDVNCCINWILQMFVILIITFLVLFSLWGLFELHLVLSRA